jgi:hypothetical protein
MAVSVLTAACSSSQSDEVERLVAKNFLRNSPTFRFDGVHDSVELANSVPGDCATCTVFTFRFQNSHPGYGDRPDRPLPSSVTSHEATVAVDDGLVMDAIIDGRWNVLSQQPIARTSTAPDVQPDAVAAVLDTPFELHVGQAAVVDSDSLKITLVEVSEDSRCPADTNCLVSGSARVQVDILEGERDLGRHEFILGQRAIGGAEKGIGQYVFTMRELNPYPGTDDAPYAAIFVVSKVVAA